MQRTFTPMSRRSFSTSRSLASMLVLLAGGLAIGGCKKDEPKTEPSKTAATDPKAPVGKDAPVGTKPTTAEKVDPTTPISPADALQPPSSTLQRGDVLGHMMLTNPAAFLGEVKSQVAPAAQAQFVDESFLRMAGGAALGSRSKLATNLDLGKPIGCALVDLASAPLPLVCVVGYTGGTSALVADLGADGKQADAAGHIAKYIIEGQELYIDEAAGGAIVSNHADAYAKGKTYVETNLIGRASTVASDLEIVAFPAAAFKRYEQEITPLLAQMGKMPPAASGNPFTDALAAYGTKSNGQMVENIKGMDQMTVALGLESAGFVARFALFPAPGSQLETQSKLAAAGPLDTAFVRKLPASSWGVFGLNAHLSEAMSSPMTKELRNVFLDAYSDGVGKDKAATQAAVDTFLIEAKATYSGHTSMAVLHEPGTLGGAVMVSGLQAGVSARESWKTWATAFTPESVLGSEGAKKVTWAFQFDAAKVGDVAVDRWVIEPSEESKAQVRKNGGTELAEWETKLGGLKLVINRAETDGKVAWVVGPGNDDKYTKAVVDALTGSNSLDGNAGATKLLDRNPGASAVFALDVKGMFGWLAEIVPPAERAKMPPGIGNDLSDVFFAQSYGETGAQSGEFVMSQALIDQIRALASK